MKKKAYSIIVILFLLNIINLSFILDLQKDNLLRVVFFDIGQGDGVFIETPEKHRIVIDGGPDYNLISEKISKEIPFWDKEIDMIILTHMDQDHLNGLLGILEKYDVKNIVWNGVSEKGAKKTDNWLSMMEKEVGGKTAIVKAGDRAIIGNTSIDFLWPDSMPEDDNDVELNSYSLVPKLCYHSNCFLFTGDISFSQENQLIGNDISADVLEISHHGSKQATSDDFLKAVDPSLAIIQVGENNYGHPSPETLGRLIEENVRTLRTDKDGAVEVDSDGKDLKIITNR
ncbi:MAG: MBL fold metallo-hydrolase [Candidatus Pacebacteria bacterium]|nr:MBL fold metallo-hydrolase [Candidatus Paceibacterota bacterium]